ncbi:MAG TPA: hypothetical protein VIO62_01160 [Candidatus Dormibacteraeota bacterium]
MSRGCPTPKLVAARQLHTEITHADEQQRPKLATEGEQRGRSDEGPVAPLLADAILIQRLQATAGNAAVAEFLSSRRHRTTAQRLADPGVQAALQQGVATEMSETPGPAGAPREPKAPGPIDPAELSRKKQELQSRMPPPDEATKQAPAIEQAAAGAKQEAAKPAEPIAKGRAPGPPAEAAPASDAQSAATEAAALASQAFALAATPEVPSPPEPAAPVEPIAPVDAAGEPLPPVRSLDAGAAGLVQRIQFLRDAGHRLRQGAARETATAHRIRGTIRAAEGKIAQSESGVATLQSHTVYRRQVSGQAKSALTMSEEKAATVAEQAPAVVAKGEQGGQQSGPMAGEAKHLAEQNASKQPDDADAAAKSRDQGQKLTKVGSDLGTMDSAISQTTARASTLVQDAAQAKAKNTETQTKIATTEASLAQTEARAIELAGQNAAARGQLANLAAGPDQVVGGARHLDEQGQALIQSSAQLEADLHRARQSFVAGLQAVPPRQAAAPAVGAAVQRSGYEGRTNLNLGGTVTEELPDWLTGATEPSQQARQQIQQQEAQRHQAELAEINQRAGGNFQSLDAADKAGIALRLTGRHLLGSVGATSFPNFVGGIARAFVDPRLSLMGVIAGLSMTLSGIANLLSADQWEKDPLGNLLKSSADIATGVTIVLGSIAGLAVAIIVVLTALTILSFGALGPIAAMVIPFCATVAATVGPWAITAAEIALVLQGLVLIKNLIDAATAQTAEDLETKSDQMTEDATAAGQMAMQIGMAKAMSTVGEAFGGGAGGEGGAIEGGEPPTVTEPHPFEAAPDGQLQPMEPAPAQLPVPETPGAGMPESGLELDTGPKGAPLEPLEPHPAGVAPEGESGLELDTGPRGEPVPAQEPNPQNAPYENNNPKATADETRVGEMLNKELPETVSGAAETPNARSGDYRFQGADGTVKSGDLYQPQSGSVDNIRANIIEKTGQAQVVVVEFGAGKTAPFGTAEAAAIAKDVLGTPGHSIERVIFVKDGAIIYDTH